MKPYKKVEQDLRKYNSLKVSVENHKEQIELMKEDIQRVRSMTYDHINFDTNEVHRSVENEILDKKQEIKKLEREIQRNKVLIDRIDRSLEGILNEPDRKILKLFYMDDETWYDVAAEVGMSPDHCKRRRSKAIQELIPVMLY